MRVLEGSERNVVLRGKGMNSKYRKAEIIRVDALPSDTSEGGKNRTHPRFSGVFSAQILKSKSQEILPQAPR